MAGEKNNSESGFIVKTRFGLPQTIFDENGKPRAEKGWIPASEATQQDLKAYDATHNGALEKKGIKTAADLRHAQNVAALVDAGRSFSEANKLADEAEKEYQSQHPEETANAAQPASSSAAPTSAASTPATNHAPENGFEVRDSSGRTNWVPASTANEADFKKFKASGDVAAEFVNSPADLRRAQNWAALVNAGVPRDKIGALCDDAEKKYKEQHPESNPSASAAPSAQAASPSAPSAAAPGSQQTAASNHPAPTAAATVSPDHHAHYGKLLPHNHNHRALANNCSTNNYSKGHITEELNRQELARIKAAQNGAAPSSGAGTGSKLLNTASKAPLSPSPFHS